MRPDIRTASTDAAPPPPIASNLAHVAAVRRVLPGYVAGLGGQVGLMLGHRAAGRRPQLRRLAHQLRGSGGAYGFPAVTELAAAVESAVDAGLPLDCAGLTELVDLLRRIDGYDLAGEAGPAADFRRAG